MDERLPSIENLPAERCDTAIFVTGSTGGSSYRYTSVGYQLGVAGKVRNEANYHVVEWQPFPGVYKEADDA